jgi:three-Cys-motif partner protein
MNTADTNPEYWSEYSNLQHVKHALIKEYLKGWFPKMTLGPWGCRRLLYIDTHAGRGKHMNGQPGSPLVALTTLLNHNERDKMLRNAEVRYFFIERDEENVAALDQELAARTLPKNVFAEAESGDCFQIIKNAIASFEKDGGKMAPSFIFVDPYGFKLPGELLRKLLSYPKVELFVNVIWRELDMTMKFVRGEAQPKTKSVDVPRSFFDNEIEGEAFQMARQRQPANKAALEATLHSVFGGNDWRKIDAEDADERADQCSTLFRKITGARWGTHLRMRDNGRVRYFLLHLTNHPEGRDLMKDCMWKACPDGGFYASKSDSPDQVVLIQAEPNLKPLHNWVKEKLLAGPKRWQTLTGDLREELWLEKHLNEVLRDMRRDGDIEGTEFAGKFAQTNNPLLRVRIQLKQQSLFD